VTMDAISVVIWLLALTLAVIAYSLPGRLHVQGLKAAGRQAWMMLPRMFVALLISGFFSVLIPTELVSGWIGQHSGLRGIIIGSLVGGFTPGGPVTSFPIVVVLFKTGAGIPPLIAFLTAWSVFAFHRIITYEIPLIGVRFAGVRLLSSIVLPPLAGILAAVVQAALSMGS
jgi:uncharacterized membrane protein YraQ (UPF0718 family)